MYHPLAPCPRCQRHVRIAEAACPFCGASLGGLVARPDHDFGRLGRAALVAAAAFTAHCDKVAPNDAGPTTPTTAPTTDVGVDAAPDTQPDAASPDVHESGPADAVPDTQRDARPAIPMPAPTDGGPHDLGGMHPKYGMPPTLD